jgi:hypothetical protein
MFLYILIGITVTEAIWQENILPKRRITQLSEYSIITFILFNFKLLSDH